MSGKPDEAHDLAVRFCDRLNAAAGSRFKPTAKTIRQQIKARLADGHRPDEIMAVLEAKLRDWLPDEQMRPYLRPATLLNRTKFESYVGQLGAPPQRPRATTEPARPDPGRRPPPDPTPCPDGCPHTEGDHGTHPHTGERYCRLCDCPKPAETAREPAHATASDELPW